MRRGPFGNNNPLVVPQPATALLQTLQTEGW
jgi:hypothetical protein